MMQSKKLRLGITGGSGCGKTTVSKQLQAYGIPVIDADLVAHRVVEKGRAALVEIQKEFGQDVILPDGTLDRRALADIVFHSPQKLERLNEITHPYISDEINRWVQEQTSTIIGIDAAALLESGISYDTLLVVLADVEVRVRRIIQRDGLSEEQARSRLCAQKPDEYYMQRADFIIYNNAGQDELKEAVKKVIEKLGSMG